MSSKLDKNREFALLRSVRRYRAFDVNSEDLLYIYLELFFSNEGEMIVKAFFLSFLQYILKIN